MDLINLVATVKVAPFFDLKELAGKLEGSELGNVWLSFRLKPEKLLYRILQVGKISDNRHKIHRKGE